MKIVKIVGFSIFGGLVVGFIILLASGIYPIGMGMHDAIQKTDERAISGYDAVAYFKDNKATKGLDEYTVEWSDAKWYFSTEENKRAFEASPEKYAPQYGGHCSFGVSQGVAVACDPEFFLIIDSKLYLLSNDEVMQEYETGSFELITRGDNNWK